jgi:prolyl-tRNA editing enzyme YbaK/EbsC (Cys-tRNA(Pro) deacylase)
VESVVFVCDGLPVLALVQGSRRAAPGRVARAVGAERVRTASPEEVLAATGFAAGGVAPLPRRAGVRAFLDESLLELGEVWIGAGTSRHMARVAVADLVRVARAEPARVAE